MGEKCSSLMGQSQPSLPVHKIVYLGSYFPTKMAKFSPTAFFSYFIVLPSPLQNSTQSDLSLGRYSRRQERQGNPSDCTCLSSLPEERS